jgi:hypothetical protein
MFSEKYAGGPNGFFETNVLNVITFQQFIGAVISEIQNTEGDKD